mgnify:CR=1 FL=1
MLADQTLFRSYQPRRLSMQSWEVLSLEDVARVNASDRESHHRHSLLIHFNAHISAQLDADLLAHLKDKIIARRTTFHFIIVPVRLNCAIIIIALLEQ